MKEKIWIEKLIELLNEYGNEICNHWGNYQTDMDFTDRDTYWYLSKKFWFIWWLVENDKIDHWRLSNYIIDNKFFWDKIAELKEYETLLMLLSISDTPIEDLISYLK